MDSMPDPFDLSGDVSLNFDDILDGFSAIGELDAAIDSNTDETAQLEIINENSSTSRTASTNPS